MIFNIRRNIKSTIKPIPSFSKEETIAWLKKYKIKKYSFIYDTVNGLMVDCAQSVNLDLCRLEYIPVKFNEVTGDFICSRNKLRTLCNSPRIVTGLFDCSDNPLINLEGGPVKTYNFFAMKCTLKSLVGGTFDVAGNYNVDNNELTNLKGAPRIMNGWFSACHNQLTSLEGCPETINGFFRLTHNQIEDLQFFPKKVNGQIVLFRNEGLGSIQEKIKFQEFYDVHLAHKERSEISNIIANTVKEDERTLIDVNKNSFKI